MADSSPQDPNAKRYPWEFWLVIGMLFALLFLIFILLRRDIPKPDVSLMTDEGRRQITLEHLTNYNDRMLTHQKDLLAIIITAFGAWVGAGAAYFFGRENLRVAADSLLAMRNLSPRERLRQTSIKQIPPTPIDLTFKRTTKLSEVKDALSQRPERWFLPIVKEDGSLDTVINEEAVWRFLIDKLPTTITSPPDTASPPETAAEDEQARYANATVDDVIKYIEKSEGLKRFTNIHAVTSMETNVGAANDIMDSRHVYLAIVTSDGKPTHFFTTAEVRNLLLQG